MDETPRHLVSVWNPSYADDAMDAHLEVLLRLARERDAGTLSADEVYVWWAKVRSANREDPLPHAEEILALQGQIESGIETHLYLTDYRSLYVAHVWEVTDDDIMRDTPDEADHIPAYYENLRTDFWFRLFDIRRLIADDTPAVITELKKLSNTRYHDRPVSIYGGMVDLPLIVTRAEEAGWFSDHGALTDGRRWAELEADLRGETERLSRELRDNLLGPFIWDALQPASRTFLATAEAVFRARRDDPGFDFSTPAMEYAKAIETELNALIFPALARVLASTKPADREVTAERGLIDLGGRVPHQGLGSIRNLLEHKDIVGRGVREALRHDANWLLGQLPARLEYIQNMRNPAAHDTALGREEIAQLRQEVLGIGCEGLLVRVVRARLRGVV